MAEKLLLHSCCAPCSSACLERLTPEYEIYDYYYNPNITEESEYKYREEELNRLIEIMPQPQKLLKNWDLPRQRLYSVVAEMRHL